jgi:hypothetical protein
MFNSILVIIKEQRKIGRWKERIQIVKNTERRTYKPASA